MLKKSLSRDFLKKEEDLKEDYPIVKSETCIPDVDGDKKSNRKAKKSLTLLSQ